MNDRRYEVLLANDVLGGALLAAHAHAAIVHGRVRPWYAFGAFANDFFALSEAYDERAFDRILAVYTRATSLDARCASWVAQVVLVASARGKIGALSRAEFDYDAFIARAAKSNVDDDNCLVRAFKIAIDAVAFDRYLVRRSYDSNVRRVFVEFTRASRKSPRLRGAARVLQQLVGDDGAYVLAFNEFTRWQPTDNV